MTIARGEPWGVLGRAPAGTVRVHDDAAVRALVVEARRRDEPPPCVALLGGDLMRAVGGTGDASRLDGEVPLLPVDVVRVESGDATTWFVAHAVLRRSWWRGEVALAMNAQHLGRRDVTPRGHPNDGRIDLLRVASAMSPRDRFQGARRAIQGTHLPHPHLTLTQTATARLAFDRPVHVWLDGERWSTASALTLTVEPDALLVCV